jgi:hypothetical protein
MSVADPALEGVGTRRIRGWLIVIEIILLWTGLQLALGLLNALDRLDAAGWDASAVYDGVDGGARFIIAIGATAALFGWCVFVTLLFFRRSHRWPGAMTGFLVVFILVGIGQLTLWRTAPTVAFAAQVCALGLILSYLRRSRRVKETFVR